jgi:spermidine synthase
VRARLVLCAVFACSGAAALVFETLFFRLAGLALGNSVHAAALVLTCFMAGLGAGNALADLLVRRVGRPLLLFAALEAMVAFWGAALIAGFPLMHRAVALACLPVPAIAMGMTLPVLVGALSARDPNYGRVLGHLYGWNTLGAVVGALLAERLFVLHLGVRGAGFSAAGLDLAAAAGVLWLRRGWPDLLPVSEQAPAARAPGQSALLGAAFLSGAILLALEVAWFRFFLQFTAALTWNLAVMLATVLAGIALGGLAGAAVFRRRPDAHMALPHLALVAGALSASLYALVAAVWPRVPQLPVFDIAVVLMFPVSFVSGLLFTLLGRALERAGLAPTRATGRLALANTAGSALGSLAAGFWLLPAIGVEGSFLLLAAGYGAVAFLAWTGLGRPHRRPAPLLAAAGLFALAMALFPSGALESRILAKPGSIQARLVERGYERVAFREAVTETIQYFRKSLLGVPQHYVLVTNNHPMAGDAAPFRRYMKAYVYWPVALNPDLKDALLISYGVGATAKALTDTPELERIDVVDISAAILELGALVYPDPEEQPLRDPRVHAHVEDGRYFLQTTRRQFDLITAEPPPPRHAGVGNLYSREYFQRIRSRLRDGGVVSYWLSAHQLRVSESRSVLRAFCDAFPECTLWSGAGLEWMMLAVKNPPGPPSAADFARQWRDPRRLPELRKLGFPDPESLGPAFIADGPRLRRWIGDAPPLVDDRPQRIASHLERTPQDLEAYRAFMADPEGAENFATSAELARIWPEAYRRVTPGFRAQRDFVQRALFQAPLEEKLAAVLREPSLASFIPWVLGSDADAIATVERAQARRPDLLEDPALPPEVHRHAAAAALVSGDRARLQQALAHWEPDAPAERDLSATLRQVANSTSPDS